MDLCYRSCLGHRIHICLSAICLGRRCGLLVFQQAHKFTHHLCHWKTNKISFGHRCQGFVCNNNLQSSSSHIDLFICKVCMQHVLSTWYFNCYLVFVVLCCRLKKGEDKGSECASCCLKCCICGFWLLEKFIRFLNHNAYTVVAIESINFCPAAGIVSVNFYF